MLKDVTGEHLIQVPIDDSIQDFEVQLVGYMDSAVMKDMTGRNPSIINALETCQVDFETKQT